MEHQHTAFAFTMLRLNQLLSGLDLERSSRRMRTFWMRHEVSRSSDCCSRTNCSLHSMSCSVSSESFNLIDRSRLKTNSMEQHALAQVAAVGRHQPAQEREYERIFLSEERGQCIVRFARMRHHLCAQMQPHE